LHPFSKIQIHHIKKKKFTKLEKEEKFLDVRNEERLKGIAVSPMDYPMSI
jgi:hypothetical protein